MVAVRMAPVRTTGSWLADIRTLESWFVAEVTAEANLLERAFSKKDFSGAAT
jgi:hypothetical protein